MVGLVCIVVAVVFAVVLDDLIRYIKPEKYEGLDFNAKPRIDWESLAEFGKYYAGSAVFRLITLGDDRHFHKIRK